MSKLSFYRYTEQDKLELCAPVKKGEAANHVKQWLNKNILTGVTYAAAYNARTRYIKKGYGGAPKAKVRTARTVKPIVKQVVPKVVHVADIPAYHTIKVDGVELSLPTSKVTINSVMIEF